MAEAVAGHLIDLLTGMVVEAAGRPPVVLREIKRLQNTLEMIQAVSGDAEKRTEEAVKLWVNQLKDVMYDLDDVIDLCRVEFLQQMPAPAPPVCCPLLFPCLTSPVRRYEIATRIRDINDRLEEISHRRAMFHLQVQAVDPNVQNNVVSRRTSPILSSDVVGVGIDEDARKLIGRLLLNEHKPGNQIFAITGMGGIGKTTLAQKIYNHPAVQAHFEIRLWVFVSRYFSETDLLRGIVTSVRNQKGDPTPYSAQTRQQHEEILYSSIKGTKFFLVLDDVWSSDVWNHVLKSSLQNGAPGSSIIVTARDNRVAKRVGAVHLHEVSRLSDEDSWSLLCKTVIMGDDEIDIDWLRDIGLKIVNKCGGLPLALKFAGETLRTKERSQREWEKVYRSLTSSSTRFSEEFMGALYLSYEALPSHLRPCFLYCSLFLENRIMPRREVIQLWIAEGFVKPGPQLSLEEVAEEYYAEIAASSLLRLEAGDKGCSMHDVLRDLALKLAEGDSYAGDLENLPAPQDKKLRRLSIASGEEISSPTAITNHMSLRALLIFESPLAGEALRGLLHQLSHLRVLDLRGSEIKEVPSSLGKLLHLRYLNLSCTRIQVLPDSVKELRYLQFLNLSGCTNLQRLPTGITELRNLRSLDLLNTAVDQIPPGVGRIEHLNNLLGYVVSHGDPAGALEELNNLNRLRDLNIRNLERSVAINNIWPLQNKHQLRTLVLSCDNPTADASRMRIKEIFEDLRPPVCLEELTIERYFGSEFPTWMFSPLQYANLVQLNLKSCTFCQQLPPLGQLPQLKHLCISASSEIVFIDYKFYGDDRCPFPKLETLVIQDMPNWKEWRETADDALPRLRQMHLKRCPMLRYLPRCLQYSTALTELVIESADSIRAIEDLVSVTQLTLDDCPNLERIFCLPALEILKIIKCPVLEAVRDVDALQHLVLEDFALESLPLWLTMDNFTALHTLDLTANRGLLDRLQTEGGEWHNIANIPHLYAHSVDGSTKIAYSKGNLIFSSDIGETTKRYGRTSSSGEIAELGSK